MKNGKFTYSQLPEEVTGVKPSKETQSEIIGITMNKETTENKSINSSRNNDTNQIDMSSFCELHGEMNLINQDYDPILDFQMSKKFYLEIRNRGMHLQRMIKTVGIISLFCHRLLLKIKKKKEMKNHLNLAKESYMIILKASQKHFKPKLKKNMLIMEINGILVNEYRLEKQIAEQFFGGRYVPIIAENDDLIWKYCRNSHLDPGFVPGGQIREIHMTKRMSLINLKTGPLGIFFNGMKRKLNEFLLGCGPCMEDAQVEYNPSLGTKRFGMNIEADLFESVSGDPIGPIKLKPTINSRSTTKGYIMVFSDLEHGAVHMEVLEGISTREVINALICLECNYNTKVKTFTSDAGTALNPNNLKLLDSIDDEKYVEVLKEVKRKTGLKIKANLRDAHHRVAVERKIRDIKKMMRQFIKQKRNHEGPILNRNEVRMGCLIISKLINDIPYKQEDFLTPNMLINPSRFLGGIKLHEDKSRLSNINIMFKKINVFLQTFREIRKQQILMGSEDFMKKTIRYKGPKCEIQIGDLAYISAPEKFNDFIFGRVEMIDGSDALLNTQKGIIRYAISKLKIYSSLNYTLSQKSGDLSDDITLEEPSGEFKI